ncbi:carboxypeptidase-like regulatory domain-containing protein [Lentimicrobium sp. S6]|uniref:carboxypeptidase-like regulatory domain-containing protein n=1 Tax=Lentimicrobium sp. S6 TaxID=2735872 RepID=UPI0015559525|nr:carboxypeptidase-like regulatory domain-containing protein [Lentimicrobium sp. S6]NPD47501.1 hypothetical protein [Lentimicrobium sp. S6]
MITVSGNISDSSGGPLPQANVYFSDRNGNILPSHQGTASNNQGQFEFEGNGAYITASYVGYQKETKPIKRSLDFVLTSNNELKEVEVIGEKPKSIIPVKNNNNLIVAGMVGILLVSASFLFLYKK